MFIEKYVDKLYFAIICSNYSEDFICGLDEVNFFKIYKIFRKYGFYFIDDIILNYLEVFEMDAKDVEEEIIKLRDKLGNNFVKIIGNNMTYLSKIIESSEDTNY